MSKRQLSPQHQHSDRRNVKHKLRSVSEILEDLAAKNVTQISAEDDKLPRPQPWTGETIDQTIRLHTSGNTDNTESTMLSLSYLFGGLGAHLQQWGEHKENPVYGSLLVELFKAIYEDSNATFLEFRSLCKYTIP